MDHTTLSIPQVAVLAVIFAIIGIVIMGSADDVVWANFGGEKSSAKRTFTEGIVVGLAILLILLASSWHNGSVSFVMF